VATRCRTAATVVGIGLRVDVAAVGHEGVVTASRRSSWSAHSSLEQLNSDTKAYQLAKPAPHTPLHTPLLHDGVATLLLQAMPQPPQLLALVLVLISHPSVSLSLLLQPPSQVRSVKEMANSLSLSPNHRCAAHMRTNQQILRYSCRCKSRLRMFEWPYCCCCTRTSSCRSGSR